MIHLELFTDCDEQAWDHLVSSFQDGTIFHTWAWMRVIERLKGAEMLPFGIYHGSNLVGVFPLFRHRRGPLTILASPLGNVGYGGPLVNPSHQQDVFEQLDGWLQQLRVDYVGFRPSMPLSRDCLEDKGYTVRELQTFVVSLSLDAQQLWQNLKSECRTAVRRARKNKVRIEEARDKDFLDVYYRMLEDTYGKANRRPPLSAQDYGTVWDILRPLARIKVLLARHEDQVVAGIIFLQFDGKIYYWDGASFRAYYRLSPNNLLHWTLIKWGADNGLALYDMLGANIPNIARFKKSFGGELRSYTHVYKDVTWRTRVGRRLYLGLMPWGRRVQFKLRPSRTPSHR
jgi:CelD/BcsL family acetyltransferase involved in cellulose biosynthesis